MYHAAEILHAPDSSNRYDAADPLSPSREKSEQNARLSLAPPYELASFAYSTSEFGSRGVLRPEAISTPGKIKFHPINPFSLPIMNDQQIQAVLRSILFALVCIVVGFSYFNIRSTMSIPGFEMVFTDMLGGRPLPVLTQMVLKYNAVAAGISFLIPVIAVTMMFIKQLHLAFYILGVLALVNVALLMVVMLAMMAPLTFIVRSMSGGF